MRVSQFVLGLAVAGLLGISGACAADQPGWAFYGGDQGGQRFSAARQITRANVTNLQIAWTYSTRDMATKGAATKHASFEDTPILADGASSRAGRKW